MAKRYVKLTVKRSVKKMAQYLIRLDDACPTMHYDNWQKIEKILDTYCICPMVGIIPANEDPEQKISDDNPSFWEIAKRWQEKGWAIALHGYNHVYHQTPLKGLNPLWNRSEFVGLPLAAQRNKIREGYKILKNHGLQVNYFFAPSHTFDLNTLEALRLESDIRIISDTIANRPYKSWGFTFIPQVGGMPRKMPINGIWTFCLHPGVMSDSDLKALENFISEHKTEFISFNEIDISNLKNKNALSKLMTFAYFSLRRIKTILKSKK